MTVFPLADLPFLAMAAPPGQGSPLLQFVPFVLVLAIFYFVILLPMKRKQKKVDEFLNALKVGDKIVTSGGLYGAITDLDGAVIRVEIAQNVRVRMSRAAVAGYQGQPPVASES